MNTALTMAAVTTTDRPRLSTAIPMTGRGGLGGGGGCSSSLTRLEALISRALLDRPDRHRGRVATEGGAEVGARQVVERLVVDHGLDPLVERVLVGRALRVDGAVLLAGLVLPDHLELVSGLLRLGEHDRGVQEVGVDLSREQTLVERRRVGVDLGRGALELVLQEVDRRGAGVRRA